MLFRDINIRLRRQRIAITGANGTGKTTLLDIMIGDRDPSFGSSYCRRPIVGYIDQGARNWMHEETLLGLLLRTRQDLSPASIAERLIAHHFPLALAERELCSLSPGERLRAILIGLFARSPAIELLVLDEPTYSLDFPGASALRKVLAAWKGGLVVASHDDDFIQAIGIEQRIVLGDIGLANPIALG